MVKVCCGGVTLDLEFFLLRPVAFKSHVDHSSADNTSGIQAPKGVQKPAARAQADAHRQAKAQADAQGACAHAQAVADYKSQMIRDAMQKAPVSYCYECTSALDQLTHSLAQSFP